MKKIRYLLTLFVAFWFIAQVAVLPLIHNHSHNHKHTNHCCLHSCHCHSDNVYYSDDCDKIQGHFDLFCKSENCHSSNSTNGLFFNNPQNEHNHFCIGCFTLKQLLLLYKFLFLIVIILFLTLNYNFQKIISSFFYTFQKLHIIFLRGPPRYFFS